MIMKLKDLYPLLKSGGLNEYPLVTFVDGLGIKVDNHLMMFDDFMKLQDVNIIWVGTWLPFEIKLDCSFDKLEIFKGRQ